MKRILYTALAGVAVLGLSTQAANADKSANFTSHHIVDEKPYHNYAEQLPAEQKQALHEYLDYEMREPCQFYQPIPEGFVKDGCDLVREEPKRVAVIIQKKQPVQTSQPQERAALTPVMNDYEIQFDFDSAVITAQGQQTLDQIANEIETYAPSEVTLAGHTDTSGPSNYNLKLSQKRADAVEQALESRGIQSRTLDEQAYGEMNPKVPTGDGVKLRENRRVDVQFRK